MVQPGMVDEKLVESIRERCERVLGRIQEAQRRSDRSAKAVRLVVVTKSQPLEVVRAAISAGATTLGENYVEEAVEKIASLQRSGVEWHMIGHLQSRKAEAAAQAFGMVQSVDSVKLAARLDRFCAEAGKRLPVLLEFNVSGEASKFGLPAWQPERWDALLPEMEQVCSLPHLQVRGLMTMPPYFDDPEQTRPYFRRLKELQGFLAQKFPQADWSELSMGTSVDFPAAVEEGATIIRVGEAIVGPRKKQ